MKVILAITIFFLFVNTAFSQVKLEESFELVSVDTLKVETITRFEHYDNGKAKTKEILVKGKLSTKYGWYNDGSKMFAVNYKDGIKDGKEQEWYDNGNVKAIKVWSDGNLNGEYCTFFYSGEIESKGVFDNGKGTIIYYFEESGKKEKEEEIYDNFLLLTSKYWCENGQLVSETRYDTLVYNKVYFHCNGKKWKEYKTVNNLIIVGQWKEWYEDGDLKTSGEYKDYDDYSKTAIESIKINTWKYYNEEGELIKEEHYSGEGELMEEIETNK